MKRKIDKALDQWAKVPDGTRNCLIVRGIRQCGKTYSIKSFLAQKFPKNNFAFDFEKDAPFKNAILNCQNLEAVLEQLSIRSRKNIAATGAAALFFDEIQSVPNLIKLLRYFKEDYPHLHVIAAGSYLEITLEKIGSFPVGRVSYIYMEPMDFEEFLWARDQVMLSQILTNSATQILTNDLEHTSQLRTTLQQIHPDLIRWGLEYEVCGGMPAVVKMFNQTRDLEQVRGLQNDILNAYQDDLVKYVSSGDISAKVHENMLHVFAKMNNLARRVQYSEISASHSETIKAAIDMLEQIGLVKKVHFSNSLDSPLSSGKNAKDYRLFFCDSGLFHALTHSALPNQITESIHFSHDGVLGEYALVLEAIKRSDHKIKGHEVYFWENKRKTGGAEIDALFVSKQCLIACDAKRRKQKVSASLRSFRTRFDAHNSKKLKMICVVSSMDEIGYLQDRVINLPFYLTPFLMN